MDKYKTLAKKLNNIIIYINNMEVRYEGSREYLLKYKIFIEKIIQEIDEKTIVDSKGAPLGLIRGVSDYDEICADDRLWKMLYDADKYYSQECKKF